MPENYHLEYKDAEGDIVRISNEEDFSILVEDFEVLKAVKLFIIPEAMPLPQLAKKDSIIVLSEEKEEVEVIEEKNELDEITKEFDAMVEDQKKENDSEVEIVETPNDVVEVKEEKEPSFEEFLQGWLTRFENLLKNENTLVVLR
jgi:hypothetical protein